MTAGTPDVPWLITKLCVYVLTTIPERFIGCYSTIRSRILQVYWKLIVHLNSSSKATFNDKALTA